MIQISVIIPLFNKETSIRNTISSVLLQTYPYFEMVVVNDGSTDNSASIVSSFNDPRIRLINQSNKGVSSARNTGILNASNEYIAFLDGDDIWNQNYLETQVNLIQDFPKAMMWGTNYSIIKNGQQKPVEQGPANNFRGYVDNYFGSSHNDLFFSSAVVIDKQIFDTAGMFDERISISEDLDMWYRIILNSPVAYYNTSLVYYNLDAENRCAADTGKESPIDRDIKYFISKYTEEFDRNPVFSHYFNNYVASRLLINDLYFKDKKEFPKLDFIVSQLRYKDIHPKYRFIYKTPRYFGWIVFKIVSLKKHFQKLLFDCNDFSKTQMHQRA